MESQPAGQNRGPLGLETRECRLSFVLTKARTHVRDSVPIRVIVASLIHADARPPLAARYVSPTLQAAESRERPSLQREGSPYKCPRSQF